MKYPGVRVHGGRRPDTRKRCHKLSWQPHLWWHAARSLWPSPVSGTVSSALRGAIGRVRGVRRSR